MQKCAKRRRIVADASYTIALNKLHDRDSEGSISVLRYGFSRGVKTQMTDP